MDELEKKLRSKFQYLLEDESLESPETCKDTVGGAIDLYIPTWVEFGIAEEMLEYGDKHPDATIWDLLDYEYGLLGPLEISEEYDEEE